jgi:hypothetical protein
LRRRDALRADAPAADVPVSGERGASTRPPRGLKRASLDLAHIIELVNLIPPDAQVPSLLELSREITDRLMFESGKSGKSGKPAKRAVVVLPGTETFTQTDITATVERMGRINAISLVLHAIASGDWTAFPGRFTTSEQRTIAVITEEVQEAAILALHSNLPRELYHRLVTAEGLEQRPVGERNFAALTRYVQIREWRDNLRRIICSRHSDTCEIRTRTVLSLNENKVVTRTSEDVFAAAILDVDARYLKECEVCKRIFYAGRINQDACDPDRCAKTLRKRRERANAKWRANKGRVGKARVAR